MSPTQSAAQIIDSLRGILNSSYMCTMTTEDKVKIRPAAHYRAKHSLQLSTFAYLTTDHLLSLSIPTVMSWFGMTKQQKGVCFCNALPSHLTCISKEK